MRALQQETININNNSVQLEKITVNPPMIRTININQMATEFTSPIKYNYNHKINGTLSKLKSSTFTPTIQTMKSGLKLKLNEYTKHDYRMPEITEGIALQAKVIVESSYLLRQLNKLRTCLEKDCTHVLSGINFSLSQGDYNLYSCDRTRMMRFNITNDDNIRTELYVDNYNNTVPIDVIEELIKMLKLFKKAIININFYSDKVQITDSDNFTIVSELNLDKYPDVQQVTTKYNNYQYRFTINTQDFLLKLKEVKGDTITLTIDDETKIITCKTEFNNILTDISQFTVTMSNCELVKSSIFNGIVIYDYNYVLDTFNCIDSEEVTIEIDSTSMRVIDEGMTLICMSRRK